MYYYSKRNRAFISILCLITLLCVVVIMTVSRSQEDNNTPIRPSQIQPDELFMPEEGCIPDEVTAVKVAEAVWHPIYGETIQRQKPFQVELIDDSIWLVCGTMPSNANALGGVAYIEMLKRDGRIFGIHHGE